MVRFLIIKMLTVTEVGSSGPGRFGLSVDRAGRTGRLGHLVLVGVFRAVHAAVPSGVHIAPRLALVC